MNARIEARNAEEATVAVIGILSLFGLTVARPMTVAEGTADDADAMVYRRMDGHLHVVALSSAFTATVLNRSETINAIAGPVVGGLQIRDVRGHTVLRTAEQFEK